MPKRRAGSSPVPGTTPKLGEFNQFAAFADFLLFGTLAKMGKSWLNSWLISESRFCYLITTASATSLSFTMLYLSSVVRVFQPPIFITTLSGTPALW